MSVDSREVSRFEDAVVSAKKILLMIHKSPDGDALGAMLALSLALSRLGKDVVSACVDLTPQNFKFLPSHERIVQDFDPAEFDLLIVVDCGDISQTKFNEIHPEIFDGRIPIVKIDHHAMAGEFGDIRFVHADAPASCFIVTQLFHELGLKITSDIATCLLTGLYTDTGSFMHSNTSTEVLKMAAELLRSGANLALLSKSIFNNTPLSTMRLWGRVLATLRQNEKGVTLAVAKQKDFDETGATIEELAGVVDWVNAVPNTKFSILLSERGGQVKASLRTKREDVNVAKIASAFGGGGHVKAAGFAVPGHLEEEVRWKVVDDSLEDRN